MSINTAPEKGSHTKGRGGLHLSGGRLYDKDNHLAFDPLQSEYQEVDTLNTRLQQYETQARDVMRARLHHDVEYGAEARLPEDLQKDIASLYPESGPILKDGVDQVKKFFTNLDSPIQGERNTSELDLHERYKLLIGNIAQVSVASCVYRYQKGSASDPWLYIPSSYQADRLGVDGDGLNQAYDATAVLRDTPGVHSDFTRVQIKATQNSSTKQEKRFATYSPEIAMITLAKVVRSGNYLDLATHLAKEARGEPANTKLIHSSATLIFKSIKRHMNQRTQLAQSK